MPVDTNKLNILLISSRADLSGGPKAMFNLFNSMRNDEKLEFFFATPDNQYFSTMFKEIQTHFLPIPFRSFNIVTFFQLLTFCKKNKIRIIHSHGRGAGYYSRLLSPFGITVIHTLHGCHPSTNLIGKFKNKIDRLFRRLTNFFICVSHEEFLIAQSFKILNKDNTTIIPNGIDLAEIENMKTIPYKQEWPHSDNDIIIGTLTRLDPHKGNDGLIRHFCELLKEHSNYKLVIAGDGQEKENLKLLIDQMGLQNSVSLIGQIENSIGFLNSIDLYVSNSKGEGLPLSVIEALAMGKNCVLSHVSGHKDLLPPSNLYPIDNSQMFVDKILTSQYPKDFNLKNYNLKSIASKTKELYLNRIKK